MGKTGIFFKKRKFFLSLLLLFFLFTACISTFAASRSASSTIRIRIIQTTDIHGQYSSYAKPGIMELGYLVEKAREEAGEKNTLYIDCGDLFQGTFESSLDQGRMMISALNLMKCDSFIPGNHDLDFSLPVLLDHLSLFKGKILSTSWRFASPKAPEILSYGIFQKAGIKIAVIGLSPRYMESWFAPEALEGLIRQNAAKEIAKIMPQLMEEKPNLIILAMHEGEYRSTLKEGKKEKGFLSHLFRQWPQIDLVLGGHTHQVSAGKRCYFDQWYVQAPALAGGIGVIDVHFDAESRKLLSISSEIREPIKGQRSPEMEKLFSGKLQEKEKAGRNRLGSLPFAPSPMGKSVYKGMKNPFAALVGKAMREAVHTPAAFHGTMGNYKCNAGNITERRLFLLLPYENTISSIMLTPEECRKVIEEQCRNVRFGNFQIPSGIRFSFVKGKVGKFLYNEDGSLWQEGEKEIAFTSYALSGAGGRFPFLAKLSVKKAHTKKVHTITVRKAVEKYIRKHYSGRIYKTGKKG